MSGSGMRPAGQTSICVFQSVVLPATVHAAYMLSVVNHKHGQWLDAATGHYSQTRHMVTKFCVFLQFHPSAIIFIKSLMQSVYGPFVDNTP